MIAIRQLSREKEPLAGRIAGILFTVLAGSLCLSLLSHRVAAVKSWRNLPYARWLILGIFADSFLFVLASSVLLYSFDVDMNVAHCQDATLICLVCYGASKKLFWLFLADRAHVVRGTVISRLRSKLYIFNTFILMIAFTALFVVCLIYRINRLQDNICIIGITRTPLVVAFSFDVAVNLYLTALFLVPLAKSHSVQHIFKPRNSARLGSRDSVMGQDSSKLAKLAKRTFIGSTLSLVITAINLAALLGMDGEAAWMCMLTCKTDILLSAVVLHWMTSIDSTTTDAARPVLYCSNCHVALSQRANSRREAHDLVEPAEALNHPHDAVQDGAQHGIKNCNITQGLTLRV